MSKDLFTACAEQVAVSPDLVTQLLATHTPNPDGWCRCHSAHPERHPCSIRRLAELAAGHRRPSATDQQPITATRPQR